MRMLDAILICLLVGVALRGGVRGLALLGFRFGRRGRKASPIAGTRCPAS